MPAQVASSRLTGPPERHGSTGPSFDLLFPARVRGSRPTLGEARVKAPYGSDALAKAHTCPRCRKATWTRELLVVRCRFCGYLWGVTRP
jgi:hypothetical protein